MGEFPNFRLHNPDNRPTEIVIDSFERADHVFWEGQRDGARGRTKFPWSPPPRRWDCGSNCQLDFYGLFTLKADLQHKYSEALLAASYVSASSATKYAAPRSAFEIHLCDLRRSCADDDLRIDRCESSI